MDSICEAELVVAAQGGDPGSFAMLVGDHIPQLLRLAERMLTDRAAADDAVQDAIISAWRSIQSFRADASIVTWLHTIVVRSCITQQRRYRPTESLDVLDETERRWADPAYSVDPADVVAAAADAATLEAVLMVLPDIYRAALLLHDMEGYTAAEVAAMTDVPLSTAKARIRRARMAIVSALSESAVVPRKEPSSC